VPYVLLEMGSHIPISVGSEAEPQLLVRGTELVQGPSPVQSGHRAPDLLTRTGARSRFLAASYAGCFALGQLSVPGLLAKVPTRSAHEPCGKRRVLDFETAFLRDPHTSAMQDKQIGISSKVLRRAWSNRILLLATAGILFLTLYPFRFDFHAAVAGGGSPFLLGRSEKSAGLLDVFLNVLLFIPFGFGLVAKLRECGKSPAFTLALALAIGALFSYCIEFLQIYIPPRDSGWEDIVTNTSGSATGFVLYEFLGKRLLDWMSNFESWLESLLTPRRTFVVLLIYFALWFAASYRLQKTTRLRDWRSDALLVVGNDTSGKFPWKGTVNSVQIWDLALRSEVAQLLSAGHATDTADPGLLVDYDFSAGPPFRNQRQISSELAWSPSAPSTSASGLLLLDGTSWLTSRVAVPDLIANLEKTNQFTLRVLCAPAQGVGGDGRIISISQPSGFPDLTLRQEDSNLTFWFRNPLSATHSLLAWNLPGVFTAGRTRDILYSYDGSNLSLFIDGSQEPLTYRLGAATALAKSVRRIKSGELEGYNYIYYTLIFCFPGAILGIATRTLPAPRSAAFLRLACGILIPAILLEWLLVSTSGRSFSFDYLGLSVLIAAGGFLWINSDRRILVRHHSGTTAILN
jgi:VanZ like family